MSCNWPSFKERSLHLTDSNFASRDLFIILRTGLAICPLSHQNRPTEQHTDSFWWIYLILPIIMPVGVHMPLVAFSLMALLVGMMSSSPTRMLDPHGAERGHTTSEEPEQSSRYIPLPSGLPFTFNAPSAQSTRLTQRDDAASAGSASDHPVTDCTLDPHAAGCSRSHSALQ